MDGGQTMSKDKQKRKNELYGVFLAMHGNPCMKVKKPRKGESWSDRIIREYYWK